MCEVQWKEQARDELTQLWTACNAEERKLITDTVAQIDRGSSDAPRPSVSRISFAVCH